MWWMLVEQQTQKVSNLLLHSPSQQYQLKGIATLGKATRGYDPSVDIEWLRSEIVRWVLGNLMQKWYDTIPLWPFSVSSHDTHDHTQGLYQEKTCCDKSVNAACPQSYRNVLTVDTESTAVETLQGQFSGYGSTSTTVARCLDRIGLKEPLEEWSDETIERVVQAFIDEKFPTVFALNKIDHPDADKVGFLLLLLESCWDWC
jgi:ribosome-binding ATPase YchF (GTP1/OBG family)